MNGQCKPIKFLCPETHSSSTLPHFISCLPKKTSKILAAGLTAGINEYITSSDICTINLQTVVTLGGAYDGGEASPVGPKCHVICYSGQ